MNHKAYLKIAVFWDVTSCCSCKNLLPIGHILNKNRTMDNVQKKDDKSITRYKQSSFAQ
jgi:hypothetical protein